MPETGFLVPPEPRGNTPAVFRAGTTFLLVVLFGFLCTLTLHSCSELDDFEREGTKNTMADTLIGMSEGRNTVMDILVEGRRKIRATAPRSVNREGTGEARTDLYGPPVNIIVMDSLGSVETEISCNHASFVSRDQRFEFFGNVVVNTGTDRTLRAEQLFWDEVDGRFSTTGFVIITTPQDSITGYGFHGDQDLIRYELRTVTGEFSID